MVENECDDSFGWKAIIKMASNFKYNKSKIALPEHEGKNYKMSFLYEYVVCMCDATNT